MRLERIAVRRLLDPPVTAPLLACILAEETFTYKIQHQTVKLPDGNEAKGKPQFRTETEDYGEESTPPAEILAASLAGAYWPGLMPLRTRKPRSKRANPAASGVWMRLCGV